VTSCGKDNKLLMLNPVVILKDSVLWNYLLCRSVPLFTVGNNLAIKYTADLSNLSKMMIKW
jgi:hypothetical protein